MPVIARAMPHGDILVESRVQRPRAARRRQQSRW
jgi:hypothetical protein